MIIQLLCVEYKNIRIKIMGTEQNAYRKKGILLNVYLNKIKK